MGRNIAFIVKVRAASVKALSSKFELLLELQFKMQYTEKDVSVTKVNVRLQSKDCKKNIEIVRKRELNGLGCISR